MATYSILPIGQFFVVAQKKFLPLAPWPVFLQKAVKGWCRKGWMLVGLRGGCGDAVSWSPARVTSEIMVNSDEEPTKVAVMAMLLAILVEI